MKKKIPNFRSDKAAEAFVDTADLTQYNLAGARPVRFEFEKKEARVNMRLPGPLLEAVKDSAKARGIPYQRFIREILEHALPSRTGKRNRLAQSRRIKKERTPKVR
jgi:predicted DNA binding CopG/RHH family protein